MSDSKASEIAESLLTRDDLAKALSVSPNYVEKMSSLGMLPEPVNIAIPGSAKKKLRWKRSEWDNWLKSGMTSLSPVGNKD